MLNVAQESGGTQSVRTWAWAVLEEQGQHPLLDLEKLAAPSVYLEWHRWQTPLIEDPIEASSPGGDHFSLRLRTAECSPP